MSKEWAHIHAALTAGRYCALISVVATQGSTPREVGARIVLIHGSGFHGTIGGGNLENNSLQTAQELLAAQQPTTHIEKHLLGPDMGQCCGGAVTILIEVLTPNQLNKVELLKTAEVVGEFFTIAECNHQEIDRKIIEKSNQLGLINNQLTEMFSQNKHPIYIFGAGHIGKALMLHLANLPFDITWVDSRKNEFPKAVPDNFELVCLNQPQSILQQAPNNAQIFVLTHNHDMDFEIVATALQMNRFAYIGMVGSKTKKARFVSKLKKLGLEQTKIDQMITPIGIGSIHSKKPQAVAISIVADLLSRIDI